MAPHVRKDREVASLGHERRWGSRVLEIVGGRGDLICVEVLQCSHRIHLTLIGMSGFRLARFPLPNPDLTIVLALAKARPRPSRTYSIKHHDAGRERVILRDKVPVFIKGDLQLGVSSSVRMVLKLVEYGNVPTVNFRRPTISKPESWVRVKVVSIPFDVVFSSIVHFQPSGSGRSSRGSREFKN